MFAIGTYGDDSLFKLASGSKKIGIYTGTFDPPHKGHLELLMTAKKDLGLDVLYVIPNVSTPHKPGANGYEVRRDMAKLTFEGEGIIVGDESVAKMVREGSVDTFTKEVMKQMDPDAKVFKIAGDDSFDYYLKHPEVTHERMELAVARRKDGTVPIPDQVGKSKVVQLVVDENGFSSTLVRKKLASGEKPDMISEKVYEYIRKKNLYGTGPCHLLRLDTLLAKPAY